MHKTEAQEVVSKTRNTDRHVNLTIPDRKRRKEKKGNELCERGKGTWKIKTSIERKAGTEIRIQMERNRNI